MRARKGGALILSIGVQKASKEQARVLGFEG